MLAKLVLISEPSTWHLRSGLYLAVWFLIFLFIFLEALELCVR
jgi:hypothetical protein